MSARFIVGDVFDVLATLPDDSVDLVFSSPPFLALRSYLPADHPDKAKEIGSEATPADFLDTLLDVVEACDRVLAPHGSLCFELGDTFSGAGGYGSPDSPNPAYGSERFEERFDGRTRKRFKTKDDGWPEQKSLCLIPSLFAASLAYGRNLLRPERTTEPWRIRNLVVWARPNPPVGALGDKFRPATSYLTVATKSRTRYFDLDSVRGPYSENTNARTAKGVTSRPNDTKTSPDGNRDTLAIINNDGAGAPPLDYWVIPTHGYPGAHYATFPPELVVKPVKAMCPQRVCRVCGEPARRIVEATRTVDGNFGRPFAEARSAISGAGQFASNAETTRETLGWTDCECGRCETCAGTGLVLAPNPYASNNLEDPCPDCASSSASKWRAGTVLDPFAGSGTTLAVATGHGRDAIGVDIDERNAELALERVGPLMLSVEYLNAEPAA